VCPTTSVVHLGGALGVPVHCIVNPAPHCYYGVGGNTLPFYGSVTLYRRRSADWRPQVEEIARTISGVFSDAA